MFRFEWSELVTDALLLELQRLAGADITDRRDAVRASVTRVLRNAGGLPVSPVDLTDAQKTALAERLLADGVGRYLAEARAEPAPVGHYLADSDDPILDADIESMPVVDVNRAGREALKALPMIGRQRAEAIVRERADGGFFESLEDLDIRVDGVGEATKEALRDIVKFEAPIGPADERFDGDPLTRNMSLGLVLFAALEPADALVHLLESVVGVTSASPHPATVRMMPRELDEFATEALAAADRVGVLAGRDYYGRLPDLLGQAASTIRVAMFHIAFPGDSHPTKVLLDELVAAEARGVDVKVVIDRDREEDPYMSTVINGPAKEYLEANGVPCRFDDEDVLLHSKYIVIDGTRSIIGSHNWSAGSYFHFDDVSFVVDSAAFSTRLTARFDALWAGAD